MEPADKPRILIVEDEPNIAHGLVFNLEAEGYEVEVIMDGETALPHLARPDPPYDLVLLDVMLPRVSGHELARRARESGNYVPILMLTAKGQPEDQILGLEQGADDYLTKPFDLRVLLARIAGLLRRTHWSGTGGTAAPVRLKHYRCGAFDIDFVSQELDVHGHTRRLTVVESALMHELIVHAGEILSRKYLLETVWGIPGDINTRTVDNFILRLRRYIEPDPLNPAIIVSVRGAGYQYNGPRPEGAPN